MLPSLHLDLPQQEAAKEFASARKKALLHRIRAFLRRHPSSNRLLSFDEAAALGPWRLAHLGRRTVPVKSIVGSEGRYTDFDDEFLPLQGSSEQKWRSVYAALRRGEELPPVSLLKVGDSYFVRDGNHRVSVARWLGVVALDAEVVELRAADPAEAPIFTHNLPEGRRHLHPSESPPYGPPAVGGGRLPHLQLHHPRAGVHARKVSRRREPDGGDGTGAGKMMVLLQPELSVVATFFFGLFMILIVAGGSILFTYWISKDE